ncbi:hypothetical protein [Isoalcanivorax beigongshangi]|uniref:Uncharacterized protein n=1 Tax=Isoalcanivorax beigongshangi TaxID=3238810 RepID=A0ABV4AM89_9GAMM
MIKRILQNRLSYLSVSLVLFMISLPLVSHGAVNDERFYSLLGVIAINIAAAIPPVQRLLFPPKRSV